MGQNGLELGPVGLIDLTFYNAMGIRGVGATLNLYVYNVLKMSLPKDITRVISKSRDRLVEKGSNRLLSCF